MTMTIELHNIQIKDLFQGYSNNDEEGVVGFSGRLNIRPKYQREFIYKKEEKEAVINTVRHNFPLNTMYWVVARDEDTKEPILDSNGNQTYELLDGQQRTISICEFLNNKFSFNFQKFFNIERSTPDIAQNIMEYELQVYICDGEISEKLDWFRTINIAGKTLTEQELLNAQYTGEWLTKAKQYFSKTNCEASNYPVIRNYQGSDYLKGASIRQDYLATVLKWIADYVDLEPRNKTGDNYMAEHQADETASEIKNYYASVMDWINSKFKVYRKEMKGLDFGMFYNKFSRGQCSNQIISHDAEYIENKIIELINDDEVESVKGIYLYLMDGLEKHLSLRAFDEKTALKKYEEQEHKCPYCEEAKGGHTYPTDVKEYDFKDMEADHITSWSRGGKTVEDNCQMLCSWHNNQKSNS